MVPPSPALLMALAAIAGVLVSMGLLLLGVVTLLWNKLDKRFDDLEARQDKRFDQQNQRFDRLEDQQNQRFDRMEADIRAIREALLPVKK